MIKSFLRIILFLFSILVYAQNAEIQKAEDLFKTQDYNNVISTLTIAEKAVSPTTEPETLVKLYYLKGKSLEALGKSLEAAESLSKVYQLENMVLYTLKNKDTKEKLFYQTKEEANNVEKSGNFSGVKEITVEKKYSTELYNSFNDKIKASTAEAQLSLNNKNFKQAGDKFLEAYHLYKAVGQADEIFRYYSAISYHQGSFYDNASTIYQDLIKMGYTGVKEELQITDKKTGEVTSAAMNQKELYEADKTNYSVKVVKTESVEKDIYEYLSNIYLVEQKYDQLIDLGKKGLEKFPESIVLSTNISSAYQKSGKSDLYIQSIQEIIKKNPNDPVNYFNIGVVSAENGNMEQAITNYKKAIEVDPTYKNAYLNLVSYYLETDRKIEKELKNLGSTKEDIKKEDKLIVDRKKNIAEGLPIFEQAQSQFQDDLFFVRVLVLAYKITGNNVKAKEFEAKEASMSK